MTRREEIIAEAKKHEYDWGVDVDRFDVPDIFAKGAEWADKTMIDKACQWLIKCFYEQEHECGYGYYITLENAFDELNDVIDDLRKAMEE